MKKYKWDSPAEWLLEKIDHDWTPEQIQQCARELVAKLDSDTIQDLYQSDMDADDYFEVILGRCRDCHKDVLANEDYLTFEDAPKYAHEACHPLEAK